MDLPGDAIGPKGDPIASRGGVSTSFSKETFSHL